LNNAVYLIRFNFECEILILYRYQKYADLACKGIVTPEKLPPTEKTAHYHGLCCHYQIIQWSMIDDFDIQPSAWGWKLENGVLAPVMTDEEIAPQSLIKVIRGKCKVKEPFSTGLTNYLFSNIRSIHEYVQFL